MHSRAFQQFLHFPRNSPLVIMLQHKTLHMHAADCEQDMSSAISKQVNESLAKDKEGDKQGLGEQNPCEFCSKGCTCGTSCSCGSDCTCKSCSGAQTAAAEPKHKETAKAEGK